jgi:hypothetical protein
MHIQIIRVYELPTAGFYFFFSCRSLNKIRPDEYLKLENDLCTNDPNEVGHRFISSNLAIKLYIMLGGSIITPLKKSNDARGVNVILDQFCKSYLKRAWAVRCNIMNNK